MFEILACVVFVVVFAAVWLAVFKLGGMDWMSDVSLSTARVHLGAASLALDGEMHGAAERLSPAASRNAGVPSRPLFEAVAAQSRLSVPL
ncbi:MAG TPA: hypothetical protein VGN52_10830 [Burkholderiales bacterium]|jgi:hypothetical protein